MADTVKMKYHAIAIPKLTPADRILEAARQLDRAIKQLPKEGPMDELAAISRVAAQSFVGGEQRSFANE